MIYSPLIQDQRAELLPLDAKNPEIETKDKNRMTA